MSDLAIRGTADARETVLRLRVLGARLIPPYPGPLVPCVVAPPPPLLDPLGTLRDWVAYCARAYCAAFQHRYAAPMRFMTSGILEKHAQFERVAQAASLLCAHEIPPVAWCLWSHDVAQAQSTPRKATVPFTFSRVRLEKNLAWWAEVRSRYCTAPLRYAPAHIALVRDWELMSLRLLHARPETRDAVRQGVESVFPGDTFGTRVALANAEARNMQAGVERAVREGAVLWG